MKGNKLTYPTVEEIADGMCLDLGEGSHRKEQYLHWILKEISRWKTDLSKEVKTIKIELTPWKAIELPSDCVDWCKLGIQDGNVIKTFVHRKDIAIIHEVNGNNIKINNEDPQSLPDTDPSAIYVFNNYLIPGQSPGKLFGLGFKDNGLGYFTENRNEESNEIQFRTKVDAGTPIYLEYISNGWNPTAQTVIHPNAEELVSLGAHYRRLKFDKIRNKNISPDDVRNAKMDYMAEYDRVIDRMWDYSVADLTEKLSEAYMLTANPVQ